MNRILVMTLVALLLTLAGSAWAASLVDVDRLSFWAGGSFEAKAAQGQAVEKEGAANLLVNVDATKSFAGVVRGSFGVESRELRVSPGVKYRVKAGGESFASELSYDFYAGSAVPEYANEWVVSLIWSHPVGKYLVLSAAESLGLDNHEARTSIQGALPLWRGQAKP